MTCNSKDIGSNTWSHTFERPYLVRSEVHIWKACLAQPDSQVELYWGYLSEDEKKRAKRFFSERDRLRFITGRGILRELLANYLQIPARMLTFEYGLYGKPVIAAAYNQAQIQFNLSHANDLALYAFTIGRELGIDIEFIHSIPDMRQIAARYFSSREYRIWDALPDTEKELAFFLCWTRKEAFIKAIGNGLSYPLDKFAIAFTPGDRPRLLWVEANSLAETDWSYAEIPSLTGYAAAILSEGNDWRLRCFEYQALSYTATYPDC